MEGDLEDTDTTHVPFGRGKKKSMKIQNSDMLATVYPVTLFIKLGATLLFSDSDL